MYIDKNVAFGERMLITNQYAVTEYSRKVSHESSGVPGIFIKYDIEPISVTLTESRQTFMHFLTRLCGIVGGVYVTVGLLNNILLIVQKKLEG